jgi:hypothetical protein
MPRSPIESFSSHPPPNRENMQGMEVGHMDNETAKCQCVVDMEGYHQCASCANGTTNPVDFLSGHDMDADEFNESEEW